MFTYPREPFNERMDVGCGCDFFDLLQGHHTAVITIGNVLSDAAVEQHRLLGDDGCLGTQPLHVQFSYINTIKQLPEQSGD